MCGMLTRTAKSRVSANRNMELTLLMTEQKHVLGYVLNEGDWPVGLHTLDENIEDADGNLSLLKAFAHRIAVSRPEAVRAPARTRTQRFGLLGRVKTRPPHGVEVQRIREFMAGLQNYEREKMPVPATICLWRWCRYRSGDDNKKEDFKVTSRSLRRENNSRNASFVSYKDSQGHRAYGEVQFYFSTRLPSELQSQGAQNMFVPEDSDSGEEGEDTGTTLHKLAYIRKISVELEYEDNLVRIQGGGRALEVIPASSIDSLIGRLKMENEVYLTARFTSMIGRMQ